MLCCSHALSSCLRARLTAFHAALLAAPMGSRCAALRWARSWLLSRGPRSGGADPTGRRVFCVGACLPVRHTRLHRGRNWLGADTGAPRSFGTGCSQSSWTAWLYCMDGSWSPGVAAAGRQAPTRGSCVRSLLPWLCVRAVAPTL